MDRVEGMLESIMRQLQRGYPGAPGNPADISGPDSRFRTEPGQRFSNRNKDEFSRPDNPGSQDTVARTTPNAAPRPMSSSSHSMQRRMEALEQQRAALQRQLETVERELQDLKTERERLPETEMENEPPRPSRSNNLLPETRQPEGQLR